MKEYGEKDMREAYLMGAITVATVILVAPYAAWLIPAATRWAVARVNTIGLDRRLKTLTTGK
jgi:hypothetical protein